MKDYIKNIDANSERRFLPIEERKKEGRTIEGYAALFNSDSELFAGEWTERIAPGAFDDVLNDDAVALFNHDSNLILARNKVNMKLEVDEKGLRYTFEAPNTTAGNDLVENIANGNVRQSSFAFTVDKDEWEHSEDKAKPSVRTIKKMKRLYDVSPVTTPAYPDTTVGKRTIDSLKEEAEKRMKAENERVFKLALMRHALFMLKNK